MKNTYTFLLAILLFVSGYGQAKKAAAPKDSTESFIININGKEYVVKESAPLTIKGALNNPVITVRMPEFKQFESGSVSFNYPRKMSAVPDISEGVSSWTINGDDFEIFFYEFSVAVTLDDIVKEVVSKFGEANCKVTEAEMTLGGKKLTGKRINVSLAGQQIIQEFLDIKLADKKIRIIGFQQTPDDDGKDIAEWTKGIGLIDRTIRYH